jgi:non-ribosomal peptide synthetase component F
LNEHFVHESIDRAADTHPESMAVFFGDRQLSFAELRRRSDHMAAGLRGRGVGRGDLVAVCLEPGLDFIPCLLAILKAGAAFMPFDLTHPAARIRASLADAAPKLVLCDTAWAAQVGAYRTAQPLELLTSGDPRRSVPSLTAMDAAYVMYTSGSSGKPKGITVPHQAFANYLEAAARYAGLAARDTLVCSSPAFDLTLTALFLPLTRAASVTVLPDAAPRTLLDHLAACPERRFGFLKLTPAHLRLLSQNLPAARLESLADVFIVGGEALVPPDVKPFVTESSRSVVVN